MPAVWRSETCIVARWSSLYPAAWSVSFAPSSSLHDDAQLGNQSQCFSWTVFGKTRSLRLTAKDPKQREWRLDGYPVADFTVLKSALRGYDVTLKVHRMNSAGTQHGLAKVYRESSIQCFGEFDNMSSNTYKMILLSRVTILCTNVFFFLFLGKI